MAVAADGGAGEQAVIRFGVGRPGHGGLMAAFTVALYARMRAGVRPAGEAVLAAQVAGGTLGGERYIAVKPAREPGRIATFVAGVAIGAGGTGDLLVGDVIGWFAIRRGVGAAVAGAALVGHGRLRVVPLGGLPTRRIVATEAVQCGGNVADRFASGG